MSTIDYYDIEILDELIEDAAHDSTTATGTYLDLISSNMVYQLSTEYLRKAIGGFFFISQNTSLDKKIFSANLLESDSEDDIRGVDMEYVNPLSAKIEKLEVNPARIAPLDPKVMTPNFRIPFRMYANPEEVYGDVYWREYLTGGSYGEQNFKNVVDVENVYYDIAINLKTPIKYEVLRAYEYLSTTPGNDLSIFEIKSIYKDYNKYVQNYQDWSTELTSELLMPNYNVIVDYFHDLKSVEGLAGDSAELETWMSERRIGYSKNKAELMSYTFVPGIDIYAIEKDQYFGHVFLNYPHTDEIKENVVRYQQNIMFDSEYFNWLTEVPSDTAYGVLSGDTLDEFVESAGYATDIENHASTFYHAKINFTRHAYQNFEDYRSEVTDSELSTIGSKPIYDNLKIDSIEQPSIEIGDSFLTHIGVIEDEAMSHYPSLAPETLSGKILEIIKDMDEGSITEIPIRQQSFAYANNFKSVLYKDSGYPKSIGYNSDLPTDTIGLKSFNYLQFLSYMYNNYDIAINDNYIFAGETKPEHTSTSAEDTLYRNKVSQDILNSIRNALHHLRYYFNEMLPTEWAFPLMSDEEGFDFFATAEPVAREVSEDIFKRILSPTKKFYEVMAYKIEKIAGAPTGDSSTQNVIQKFWVYNDRRAPNQIKITDSQVKYGQNYTYKISAYALVLSHKYKYSDYRFTKQIGTAQKVDPESETEEPKFCLQFYDPLTNEISSQMFTTTAEGSVLEAFIESALSLENEFATDQVDMSTYPHLADFNLYIEPCLEVVEIPLAQKTIKIMDSPPNAINVIPFHFIDNSNRLGFKIGQDSYINRPWAEIINTNDILMKGDYLKSREIMEYQKITEPSQSPARFIEMYRINKRPNSFTDFRNGLVSTIDLKGNSDNKYHNYLDYVAADEVMPNKKYYYLFRLLNENKIPGPVSQIIEAELVNDGGYIYSLFDTIDSSEFNPNKIQTKTKDCKKILQLEPHIDQMLFDMSAVDYGNTASEEVRNIIVGVADELIWDSKRFKIRLTSKKTGRKLDLNTGFNLRIKDESTEPEDPIDPPTTTSPPITVPPVVPTSPPDTGGPPEVPEPPTGTDDVPTSYGSQYLPDDPDSSWVLWSSQVYFINYGSSTYGVPSLWQWIHNYMSAISYGAPATTGADARAISLWQNLGAWLYANKDVPETGLDNHMFVEHVAALLSVNAMLSWTSTFIDDYESAIPYTPYTLGYYDSSLLDVDSDLVSTISSAIKEGMTSAGSTTFS